MTILFSIAQLDDLVATIPYPVMCIVDPASIIFPAVIKFVVLEQEKAPVVCAVPFDTSDLLNFYDTISARMDEEKPGIEGYTYAESEDSKDAGGGVQTDILADVPQTDSDELRDT